MRMSDEQRRQSGIRPLPASLRDALAELESDQVLFGALGDLLGRCILGVRGAEIEAFEQMTPEQAQLAHLRVF
jgi:glutamine synthetase